MYLKRFPGFRGDYDGWSTGAVVSLQLSLSENGSRRDNVRDTVNC